MVGGSIEVNSHLSLVPEWHSPEGCVGNGARSILIGNEIGLRRDERLLRDAAVELQRNIAMICLCCGLAG